MNHDPRLRDAETTIDRPLESSSEVSESVLATLLAVHGNQEVLGAAVGDGAVAAQGGGPSSLARESFEHLASVLGAEVFSSGLTTASDRTEPAEQTVGVPLPRDRSEALAWHDENQRRVERLVRSALSTEPSAGAGTPTRADMLRNSVEFIEEGTIELFSLTPTHDSEERAGEGKVAYFDRRRTYEEGGAGYPLHPSLSGGIEEVFPCGGHMDGSDLVVFDARQQSESDLAITVIHEVQHYADNGPGDSFRPDQGGRGSPYVAPRWAFHDYQSEFRARVVDPVSGPDFGSPENVAPRQLTFRATRPKEDVDEDTPAVEVQQTDVFSEQVLLVLSDMVRDTSIERWVDFDASGNDRWLAHYAYLPHYYVFDPVFRDMVNDYADVDGPTGGNMVNSVRVQALAEAVHAQDMADVQWRARCLDGFDLAFLRDRAHSAPFWQLVEKCLETMEAFWLSSFVQSGGVEEEQPTQEVVTVDGDTLSLLCERFLGDASRSEEVYALNRDVIGPDPDALATGLSLRMPRS